MKEQTMNVPMETSTAAMIDAETREASESLDINELGAMRNVLTETIPLGNVDPDVVQDTFGGHHGLHDTTTQAVIDLAVKMIIDKQAFNPEEIREVFITNLGESAGEVAYLAFKKGIINGMMKSYPPEEKKKLDPAAAKAKAAELAKRRSAKKAAKASKKKNRR